MSLDNLGFRCLVNGDVYGYVSFALFFVLVNAAVPMVGALSRCMTCLRRRGLAWDSYKSLSSLAFPSADSRSARKNAHCPKKRVDE